MTRAPRSLVLAAALAVLAAGSASAAPTKPPAAPPPGPARAEGELFPAAPVIYEMETLRTGALSPDFVKRLEPLHTLQQIEDFLKANRIAFAWGRGTVSSGTMPAAFAKQLDDLPPHEVFITPQPNNTWLIAVVLERH